jgi:hypothetical protein
MKLTTNEKDIHIQYMNKIPSTLRMFVSENNHLCYAFGDYHITDEVINQTILEHGPADYITNDFYCKLDSAHNILCVPLTFYSASIPVARSINHSFSAVVKTEYCFNFSVNLKRINRFIMIKLIEWFGLTNMDYTWSGVDSNFDMSIIIEEINSIQTPPWSKEFQSFLLAPITMQKKWINTPDDTAIELTHIRTVNKKAWHAGLDQLYSHSAVSLIAESIDYQAGAGYTEKTAYAVFGQTFPIWIGGKYQAEQFAKLGYDTFDDVIDHSYQYKDTLIERCYYAIADNLEILRNLEHATVLRNNLSTRLTENRQKLLADCTLPTSPMLLAKLQKITREWLHKDFDISDPAVANFKNVAEDSSNMQINNQPGSREPNFENRFIDKIKKYLDSR